MPLLIPIIGLAIIFYSMNAKGATNVSEVQSVDKKRNYDLDDIDPDSQGGTYKKDYDFIYEANADKYDVPFALLKAHSLQESSINPDAFLDENPQKDPKRVGWASRGLMQLLFWPGSTRFEKYGFSADRDPDDLYDPSTNVEIAAQLIADNLKSCKGSIRDAINMYNAGVKESVRQAPGNYVGKVLGYYSTLIKKEIS